LAFSLSSNRPQSHGFEIRLKANFVHGSIKVGKALERKGELIEGRHECFAFFWSKFLDILAIGVWPQAKLDLKNFY